MRSPDGRWYQISPSLEVEGASQQLFVIMNVANVGRRPLQWQSWGGEYVNPVNGRDTFNVIPTQLPKMLGEGETHNDLTALKLMDTDNVRRLYARDGSDKDWYVSRHDIKKLKADARKYGNYVG